MPTADEVVVTLQAKADSYIADLAKAERAFNKHQANVLKNANIGGAEFRKAQAQRAASAQAAANKVARQQALQTKAILAGSKRQAKAVEDSTDRIVRALNEQRKKQQETAKATTQSSQLIRRALAGVSLAVLTQQGLKFEEAYRNVNNTLRQYEDVLGDASASTSRLTAIASEAGQPVQNLEFIMGAASRSARDLGRSGEDVFLFGELTAKGAQLANTGAAGVEGAMTQLSQAITSPRVQLQEFNSVVEGTPRLAQAFADSIDGANGSIGDLRREIANGNVTGNDLFEALLSQADTLRAEFETLDLGPRQSLARLNNALAEFIGTNETAVGGTKILSASLDFLANNLDTVADTLVVAGAAAAAFFGTKGLIAATAATRGLIAQLVFVNTWAGRSTVSLRTAAVAAQFFIKSLGPLGIAATVVASAAAAFALLATRTGEARAEYDKLDRTLTTITATNTQIASDEQKLKRLLDQTTESLEAQGEAALAARDVEVQAVSDRILKNKGLLETYKALADAQVQSGEQDVNDLELSRNEITGVTQRIGVNSTGFGSRVGAESDAEFAERAQAAFDKLLESAARAKDEGRQRTKQEIAAAELTLEIETKRSKVASDRLRVEALDKASKSDEPATNSVSEFDNEALREFTVEREKAEAELAKAQELNSKAEIERAEKRLAIVKRTVELLEGGSINGAQAERIAKDEISPKKSSKARGKTDAERADEKRAKEIEAIREIGKTELAQIEDLKQSRLEAVAQSLKARKIEADEAKALNASINADAMREIEIVKKAEQDAKDQAVKDAESQAENNFRHHQDELGYISEIAAAIARSNGRALEATQIELDATRERYEAELAYIDEVIAKKGLTPELSAERANAEAGIAGVDADEASLKKDALSNIQSISDGGGGINEPRGLSDELALLEEEQEAKLAQLEEFRSNDLELLAAYEAEKLQIIEEYNELKKQARIADLKSSVETASSIASTIGKFAKEGSAAQKAAARVEQGIALGRAVVNTALAISTASALPFPLNIAEVIRAAATGAAQVATISAQGFKDGVVGLDGPGTERSDSIPANLSRGESVITAAATRGNEAGLRGLNAGLSPEQAFNFQPPNVTIPDVSVPSLGAVSNSSNNLSFEGSTVNVSGGVDGGAVNDIQAAMKRRDANFTREVLDIVKKREARTTPRSNRRNIGRR